MKQLSVNKSYENYAKFDVIWATAIQCGINSVSRMIYEKTANGYLMLQIEWLHSRWMRTWMWIESRNSEMEMETDTEFRDGEWWLNSNHLMCQIARLVKKNCVLCTFLSCSNALPFFFPKWFRVDTKNWTQARNWKHMDFSHTTFWKLTQT